MKSQFDDPARVEYINELYDDRSKAYFKMDMHFSNAVLVDVCEILFSATTRWVAGSSRKLCSLLMAVARIAQGCRNLIIRPFLKEPEKTMAYISRKSSNYAVTGMFKFLSLHLTQWAVQKMYDLLDQNWTKYDSHLVASNNTTAIVNKFVSFAPHTVSKLLLYSSFTPQLLLLLFFYSSFFYSSFTPHLLLNYSFYSSFTPHLLLIYSSYTPHALSC